MERDIRRVSRRQWCNHVGDIAPAMCWALALVAAMLQRGGVISVDEFANILGIFAVTVGESEPDEGEILALWAGIVKESAEEPRIRIPVLMRLRMAVRKWLAWFGRARFVDPETHA
jgi:hypothetical protein